MIQTTDKLPRWWIWLILGVAAIAVIAYFLNRHARIEAIQNKEAEIQIVKKTIGQKQADNLAKNTSAIQSSESDVKAVKKVVKVAKIKPVIEVSDSVIYSEDFQRWLKKGE